jgi:hypothetical protein
MAATAVGPITVDVPRVGDASPGGHNRRACIQVNALAFVYLGVGSGIGDGQGNLIDVLDARIPTRP